MPPAEFDRRAPSNESRADRKKKTLSARTGWMVQARNGSPQRVCDGAALKKGTEKPQATLPGGLGPVPPGFRRARLRYMNATVPFQLLPAGPLAFPLSSIAWGIYYFTTSSTVCQENQREMD